MKKFLLFLMTMVLTVVGTVSSFALNVKPTFSPMSTDGETIQYLYNVETGSFVLGANDWGTRASVSVEKGYQVKVTPNGENYKINDLVGSNWNALDCDGGASSWVDGAGRQGDGAWVIKSLGNNTYEITNTFAPANSKWGVVLDLTNTRIVFTTEAKGYGTTWAFVNEADYEKYLEAAADEIEAEKQAVIYAANKASLDAQKALIDGTNIYGEGYDAYVAKYESILSQLENGNLTETVVNPTATTGWHSSTDYNFLLTPWTIGGEKANNFDKPLYINTWSTEGVSDGSNFLVPFFEYWTGDDASLGATALQAKVTGLTPNGKYEVSAWTRVRIKNGAQGPTGITLQAGNGEPVNVCAGTQYGQMYAEKYTAVGTADADGTLTISYNVAADNNISWLSYKDVKYTEVGAEEPIDETVTVSLIAGNDEYTLNDHSNVTVDVPVNAIKVHFGDINPQEEVTYAIYGMGRETLAEGTVSVNTIGYAAFGKEVSLLEGAQYRVVVNVGEKTYEYTVIGAVEPIAVPEITNLTADMFHVWSASDASAEQTTAAPYCVFVLSESTDMPYGNGNVDELQYADLSDYDVLSVTATEGQPRFLMNRDVKDGQNPDHLINIPNDADQTAAYQTVIENADGSKTFNIDLAKIVADKGYAHLHAIKGANWANTTVTEISLIKNAGQNPTIDEDVTVSLIAEEAEYALNSHSIVTVDVPVTAIKVQFGDTNPQEEVTYAIYSKDHGTLAEGTVSVNTIGYAAFEAPISFYEGIQYNVVVKVGEKTYDLYLIGAIEEEQPEQPGELELIQADLTGDMYAEYTTGDANAQIIGAVDCEYTLNKSTQVVYGVSNLAWNKFADLSKCEELVVVSTQGQPRICINRRVDAGNAPDGMIDYPANADQNAKYFTATEENGVTTTKVNIKAIVEDYGFAHLHAIKSDVWPNTTTVTNVYVTMYPEVEEENVITPAFLVEGEENEFALNSHSIVTVPSAVGLSVHFGEVAAQVKKATYAINEIVTEEFLGEVSTYEKEIASGDLSVSTMGYVAFDKAINFYYGHKYNVVIKAWDTTETMNEDLTPVEPIAQGTFEFHGSNDATPEVAMGQPYFGDRVIDGMEIDAAEWNGLTIAYPENNLESVLGQTDGWNYGAVALIATEAYLYEEGVAKAIAEEHFGSDFEPASATIFAEAELKAGKTYNIVIPAGGLTVQDQSDFEAPIRWSNAEEITFSFKTAGGSSSDVTEVVPGDYYIKNVLTGLYLNGANSWGTQASVVSTGQLMTVAKLEDGTYTIDSHISNGGDKHFLGTNGFVDSPAAGFSIESAGNGTFAIKGEAYLALGENNTVNFTGSAVTDDAKWVFLTKDDILATIADATPANPVEISSLLADANFGRNNQYFSAWEGDVPGKNGDNANMNAEKWGGNSQEFDSHQTISLPNGKYIIKAQGFYRYNNTTDNTNDVAAAAHADGSEEINSYLYANDVQVALMSIADEATVAANDGIMPFSQGEASAAFNKGLYNNELTVEVTDGTLTIGIKKTSHPGCDWTVWDNIQIFSIGADKPEIAIELVNGDFKNGFEGWTTAATGGSWAINSEREPVTTEVYAGWGNLDLTDFSMSQKVVLPAGTYKLSASAFYRYGLTYDVDPSKSCAKLYAGDESVDIVTLGSIEADTYANSMAEASAAFAEGKYLNELTFTVEKDGTEVEVGVAGAHELKQSWFLAGTFKLEALDTPIDETVTVSLLAGNDEYTLNDHSIVTVDVPVNAIKVHFGDRSPLEEVKYAIYDKRNTLASGTLSVNNIGYADFGKYISLMEGVQYNVVITIGDKDYDFYVIGAIEPILVPEITKVSSDMFKKWTSGDASAEYVSDLTDAPVVLNESAGQLFGYSTVNWDTFADFSDYDQLVAISTEGQPRFCMNRTVNEGQAPDGMIDLPNNADQTAKYLTVVENEDGSKTATVDLQAMVADYGFARLHAMKGAAWANCTMTDLYLVKMVEQDPNKDEDIIVSLVAEETEYALNSHSNVTVDVPVTGIKVQFGGINPQEEVTYVIYDKTNTIASGYVSVNTIGFASFDAPISLIEGVTYSVQVKVGEAEYSYFVIGAVEVPFIIPDYAVTVNGKELKVAFAEGTDCADSYDAQSGKITIVNSANEVVATVTDFVTDNTTGGFFDPLNVIVATLDKTLESGEYAMVIPAGRLMFNGDTNPEMKLTFSVVSEASIVCGEIAAAANALDNFVAVITDVAGQNTLTACHTSHPAGEQDIFTLNLNEYNGDQFVYAKFAKVTDASVQGDNLYTIQLHNAMAESYNLWGANGYVNFQTPGQNIVFCLGLNNQYGQDGENCGLWEVNAVEGGYTIKNVGNGGYYNPVEAAPSAEPVVVKLFKNVAVDADSPIVGVSGIASTIKAAGIYTTSGAKVNTLQKGINIVVDESGAVTKVIRK